MSQVDPVEPRVQGNPCVTSHHHLHFYQSTVLSNAQNSIFERTHWETISNTLCQIREKSIFAIWNSNQLFFPRAYAVLIPDIINAARGQTKCRIPQRLPSGRQKPQVNKPKAALNTKAVVLILLIHSTSYLL